MRRREFIAALGGSLACPLGSWAQQATKTPRIAFIHPAFAANTLVETGDNPWRAFFGELRSLGYVEGKNLIIDRHSGNGISAERYAELVRRVASRKPDLIVTAGFPTVQLFKTVTRHHTNSGLWSMTLSPQGWLSACRGREAI